MRDASPFAKPEFSSPMFRSSEFRSSGHALRHGRYGAAFRDTALWLDGGVFLIVAGVGLYVLMIRVGLIQPALVAFDLVLTGLGAAFEVIGGALYVRRTLKSR